MKKLDALMAHAADDISLWALFMLLAGAGASALGLSVLLRSGGALTVRAVVAAVLHSAIWGVVIFLVGYDALQDKLPMLLGFSISSGLGTASMVDLLLMVIKNKLGITVTINPPARAQESNDGKNQT